MTECSPFAEDFTDGVLNSGLFGKTWLGDECGTCDSDFSKWSEGKDSSGEACLLDELKRSWQCSSGTSENALLTNIVPGQGNFIRQNCTVTMDVYAFTDDGCWQCDSIIDADLRFYITDGTNKVEYYRPAFNTEGTDGEGCQCATIFSTLSSDRRHVWTFKFDGENRRVKIAKDGTTLPGSPFDLSSLGDRWSFLWWGQGHNFQTAYCGNVDFRIYKYQVGP